MISGRCAADERGIAEVEFKQFNGWRNPASVREKPK